MNCDLSPLSATNSAKQLERSKKMENAEQEFVSVVREYERVIYKVCYLYTTPNATLNDLYQEVVLNLWKAFPKFRRECKISDVDLPHRPEHLHQLYTQRKEHPRNRYPQPRSRPELKRTRGNTSHATATLPDDKPAGTIGKIHHPALSGREKLRRNCRNHRADPDKRCHQAQPHQRQIEKNE